MTAPGLERVVPNETWQLVIEFGGAEHRLFDAEIARKEMSWPALAYPNRLKNLSYTVSSITWPEIGELSAAYLYRNSTPLTKEGLEHQVLRLSYKNQAPTETHPTHHVYGVYLFPFSANLFDVGESIGGGHGEMGGSRRMRTDELLALPDWKRHFRLSGCDWAIPIVEGHGDEPMKLSDVLVREICRREGELSKRT
ncbi:hypothetical protein [Dyella tabacisoli]|uniref:Uncharacterized protein n=1 Tax=Dyella tabacisoli TaxID=2282381 RepID=A0A369UYY9_9GAMM|nr:hypothetical protein [Dyella tabacisoli]RDD83549.1 hypothetical protein DVJ77_02945 [Dyella tabacisoli]